MKDLVVLGDIDPRCVPLGLSRSSGPLSSRLVETMRGSITVANLEGPLLRESDGSQPMRTGRRRRGDPQVASTLGAWGINAVTLANNHLMDFGPAGVDGTIGALRAFDILPFGAGLDRRRAFSSVRYESHDQSWVLLGIAQNEFGSARSGSPGIAVYQELEVLRAVARARHSPSDVLVILFHAGVEYFPIPSPEQRRRCEFLLEVGADVVICQHSHVGGAVETKPKGWICYGQGDFLARTGHRNVKISPIGPYAVRIRSQGDGTVECEPLPLSPPEIQGGTGPVDLLMGEDRKRALAALEKATKLVSDGESYWSAWDEIAWELGRDRVRALRFGNRLLRRILRRLPLFEPTLSDGRAAELVNLVRCEAHRDVLVDHLEAWLDQSSENPSWQREERTHA